MSSSGLSAASHCRRRSNCIRGNRRTRYGGARRAPRRRNRTLPVIVEGARLLASEELPDRREGARRLAIPEKAQLVDMIGGRVIIQLKEGWSAGGKTSPLEACSRSTWRGSERIRRTSSRRLSIRRALARRLKAHLPPRTALLVSILDNVRGRTLVFNLAANGSWTRSALDASRQFDDRHCRHEPRRRPRLSSR